MSTEMRICPCVPTRTLSERSTPQLNSRKELPDATFTQSRKASSSGPLPLSPGSAPPAPGPTPPGFASAVRALRWRAAACAFLAIAPERPRGCTFGANIRVGLV